MKVSLEASKFSGAVGWVSKSLNAKDHGSYIVLSVSTDGRALFSHNGDGVSATASVSLDETTELEKDERISLNGPMLQKLGALLSRDKGLVELVLAPGDSVLHVSGDKGKFSVELVASRSIKTPELTKIGSIEDSDFFRSIKDISKVCDPGNAGEIPAIGSIDLSFNPDENYLTLMATNGYTLSEVKKSYTPDSGVTVGKDTHYLIPARFANTISAGGMDGITDVYMDEDSGKLGFTYPDGKTLAIALTNGEPQLYSTLKDTIFNSVTEKGVVVKRELEDALNAISVMSQGDSSSKWSISGEGIQISDDFGQNEVTVPFLDTSMSEDFEGKEISVLRDVVIRAFHVTNSKNISIQWSMDSSPIVVRPNDKVSKKDKSDSSDPDYVDDETTFSFFNPQS